MLPFAFLFVYVLYALLFRETSSLAVPPVPGQTAISSSKTVTRAAENGNSSKELSTSAKNLLPQAGNSTRLLAGDKFFEHIAQAMKLVRPAFPGARYYSIDAVPMPIEVTDIMKVDAYVIRVFFARRVSYSTNQWIQIKSDWWGHWGRPQAIEPGLDPPPLDQTFDWTTEKIKVDITRAYELMMEQYPLEPLSKVIVWRSLRVDPVFEGEVIYRFKMQTTWVHVGAVTGTVAVKIPSDAANSTVPLPLSPVEDSAPTHPREGKGFSSLVGASTEIESGNADHQLDLKNLSTTSLVTPTLFNVSTPPNALAPTLYNNIVRAIVTVRQEYGDAELYWVSATPWPGPFSRIAAVDGYHIDLLFYRPRKWLGDRFIYMGSGASWGDWDMPQTQSRPKPREALNLFEWTTAVRFDVAMAFTLMRRHWALETCSEVFVERTTKAFEPHYDGEVIYIFVMETAEVHVGADTGRIQIVRNAAAADKAPTLPNSPLANDSIGLVRPNGPTSHASDLLSLRVRSPPIVISQIPPKSALIKSSGLMSNGLNPIFRANVQRGVDKVHEDPRTFFAELLSVQVAPYPDFRATVNTGDLVTEYGIGLTFRLGSETIITATVRGHWGMWYDPENGQRDPPDTEAFLWDHQRMDISVAAALMRQNGADDPWTDVVIRHLDGPLMHQYRQQPFYIFGMVRSRASNPRYVLVGTVTNEVIEVNHLGDHSDYSIRAGAEPHRLDTRPGLGMNTTVLAR